MSKYSLNNIACQLKKQAINHQELGKIFLRSVKLDKPLKKFYNTNYYQGYILGNSRLFNWMFKHNKSKVPVLSLPSGEIIAHQGLVPIVFTDGKNDQTGIISASTMVAPDYRRKGLMSHLRGTVQNHFQTAVSIGGSAQGVALYTAMGYRHLGDLTRLVAITNPSKCKGISKKLTSKNLVKLDNQKNLDIRPIKKFQSIQQQLNSLWQQVFPSQTYFAVKRDFKFLDWRYTNHPIFKYHPFGLWHKNQLKADITYRIEKISSANTQVIRITELFGQPRDIREIVNATVLSEKLGKQVGWIDWYYSNQKIHNDLKSCGFKTKQQLKPTIIPTHLQPVDYTKADYPFMFWSKNDKLYKKLPAFNKWYITKGDGDADRPNAIRNYDKSTTNN